MIPKNISKYHVLGAIKEIERSGVPKGRDSKKYQLLFEEKAYPPKYVISLANKLSNGEELDPESYNGGIETNKFLRRLGFTISEIY